MGRSTPILVLIYTYWSRFRIALLYGVIFARRLLTISIEIKPTSCTTHTWFASITDCLITGEPHCMLCWSQWMACLCSLQDRVLPKYGRIMHRYESLPQYLTEITHTTIWLNVVVMHCTKMPVFYSGECRTYTGLRGHKINMFPRETCVLSLIVEVEWVFTGWPTLVENMEKCLKKSILRCYGKYEQCPLATCICP